MKIDVDGRAVFAYTGGRPFDPGLPVVAFLHGAQHDHSVWVLQSRWLAHHGWAVLALDLPGHGRSDGPALPSIEALAGWVPKALDAAGVDRAALVGHSMGSLVALQAAASVPSRASGVALVATAFPMKVSDALLSAARDDEPAAFDMINRWSFAKLVHRPGTPGPGFSVFVQNLRLMQRQARGVLHTDFAACDAWRGGLDAARAVRCPVLVVCGARDQMTPPRAARALIDALPRPRVVEIADSGHSIPTEAPDALRDALAGWLRTDVPQAGRVPA